MKTTNNCDDCGKSFDLFEEGTGQEFFTVCGSCWTIELNRREIGGVVVKADAELETARAAVVDYLKGFNINDSEQVREMAQLKIKVQRLEEKVNN